MDQLKAFSSRATFDSFSDDDVPSTFTDTVQAAFALTRREELSDSSFRAFRDKNEIRAKTIGELGGDVQLAQEYANALSPTVRESIRESIVNGALKANPLWRGLNSYQRQMVQQQQEFERRFPNQVPTDQAIFDEFKAEAAELRKAEQFTLERGGGVAGFLGAGGAIFTDPLVLMTLPFGAEIGAGRTALATIGRTAAIEGAIAMGIEIPIQQAVFNFKRDIESPWSFQQSAINVLAAGAGGAAIGGTIAGGVVGTRAALKGYRSAKEAGTVTPSQALDDAERVLEDTLGLHDENPLGIETVDEAGNVTVEPVDAAHERAFEDARVQHADNRPVEVADQVAGLEPDDGLNQVLKRAEDPDGLVDIDPTTLEVDAETFQFKSGGDAAGVTDKLKDVKTFDRRLAGVSLIWERADGKRFIADGHQRQALAVRALAGGQDPAEVRLNGFLLREADGITAVDARRIAAVKNMAEGSGSALDAAKILRSVGRMGEAVLPPLPPRSALIRQARGLANLSEDNFLKIINDVIDTRFGALVGGATEDPKLQAAMIDVIRRTKPANETQARSIVDQVRATGVETRITEDLFGSQEISESLILERAQVLDVALKEARKDKAVFGRLLSEEGRITEAGTNRLDHQANQIRMQEASDATTQISRLANTKGPISEALTEAARQVKAGKKPAEVAQSFLDTTRRTLLEGDRGGREAGGTRSGSDAAGGERSLEPTKGNPVRLSQVPAAERQAALVQLLRRQADVTVDQIYERAAADQKLLAKEAKKIVDELGEDIELADPGIKKRKTAEEKLGRKGKSPGELTDIVRLGFLVRTPELAAKIIDRLSEVFEVLDEGVTVTGMGYVDHKALVRFSDGRIGEVQLWDPELAAAKFGEGGKIYDSVRSISADDIANDPVLAARVTAATEASKDLYANALAKASSEWRREAMLTLPEDMRKRVQAAVVGGGTAGAPGNISKKALRESSEPDSKTSTGDTRDQAVASKGTKSPSSPPGGVSLTTAGRASQLKNLSAIDAPPRKIVREVDDTRIPAPEATRTGTVPDLEYDAVMAKAQELIENQGELARVGREINGELETRSLASELDQLDTLEDTLERIRICSAAPRVVA